MKRYSKYVMILIFLLMICLPIISKANDDLILPQYTDAYKNWMELSDEEKQNYIEPQIFETEEMIDGIDTYSLDADMNSLSSSLPSAYTRQNELEVKNQGTTNACWAYSAASVFDENYYVTNRVKKQFSNLHIDYKTSMNYNTNGFYRTVDSGGNMQIALAYATNGMGIALESEMPKNNITSASLQNINSKYKVRDYVKLTSIAEIKNYIYNYGVVSATTYVNGTKYFSSSTLYSNSNLAYCCTNSGQNANHAITIVGWNDNYTNPSFPNKQGAYVVLNSYGNSFGNNGIYYIFYEDAILNNSSYFFGVTKVDEINYDYIYQHDEYGWTAECGYSAGTYAANVFSRKNTSVMENLTEVSIYVPKAGEITIYINPYSNDVIYNNAPYKISKNIAQAGYYTIKLDKPIQLQGNQFVIGAKYPKSIGAEIPTSYGWCSTTTSNPGEGYISPNGVNFVDFQAEYSKYGYRAANICIKAYTEMDDPANYCTVNVSKNYPDAGYVTYGRTVKKGNEITINVVPNPGYRFIGLYNGNTCITTNTTYTFKPSSSINLMAKFEYFGDISNYVFDYKYYADHNLDLYELYGYNPVALETHWNYFGKAEGRNSSCVFDVRYYVENNSDLAIFKNNYVAAYNHFVNYGFAEFRKSSPEYDGNYYRKNNSDLKNMTSYELIKHYKVYGKGELRRANTSYDVREFLLDLSLYAELNPDVAKVCGYDEGSLRNHWYRYGIAEGRIASLIFDPKYYLKANSDVAKNYSLTDYKAAYNHFVNYGFNEGRQGSSVFSVKYYIEKNFDIKNVFGENYLRAVNHFVCNGKNEARTTSPVFNVTAYRQKNTDLIKLYNTNYYMYFKHYLQKGQIENRPCI